MKGKRERKKRIFTHLSHKFIVKPQERIRSFMNKLPVGKNKGSTGEM